MLDVVAVRWRIWCCDNMASQKCTWFWAGKQLLSWHITPVNMLCDSCNYWWQCPVNVHSLAFRWFGGGGCDLWGPVMCRKNQWPKIPSCHSTYSYWTWSFIVDWPIKSFDFPYQNFSLPDGIQKMIVWIYINQPFNIKCWISSFEWG